MTDAYVIRLDCDHTISISGPPHDTFYCARCMHYENVVQWNAVFRWKCMTCHSGRSYGAARFDMERGAMKHGMRNPSHVLQEMQGEDVVLRVNIPSVRHRQSELPLDVPPF